jgi:hypothetical protein
MIFEKATQISFLISLKILKSNDDLVNGHIQYRISGQEKEKRNLKFLLL